MNDLPPDNHSPKNKVATLIARVLILLFGIGLLAIFMNFKIWKKADVTTGTLFGAFIGLCVGYGLGGDIWGARIFDLFTGLKVRREVEADGEVPSYLGWRFILVILAIVGAALIGVFAWYLLKP
jgi:hypothetical protein